MVEKEAYSQAAGTGNYEKPTGLFGKYDNARRYWEDQITAIFLAPALEQLVLRKNKNNEKLRILDLGCGSGDGYELLMGVRKSKSMIAEPSTNIISPDMLEVYIGVDINEDLLGQAEACHRHNSDLEFICADISEGLPRSISDQEPFDVYFTSYGTLSHFYDDQNAKLIADIFRPAPQDSIFMGDWLGSHSYEWQDLWLNAPDSEQFMDYRISYIFPEEERGQHEISAFPLKLMTRDKIKRIMDKASRESEVQFKALKFFDRSIIVGRHTDTGDYNPNCVPYRKLINSLYEVNNRTDLNELKFKYSSHTGFEELNRFFDAFFAHCAVLVKQTVEMLKSYDEHKAIIEDIHVKEKSLLNPVKDAILSMRRLIYQHESIENDDFRANMIEPHLAYLLRKIEIELQPGTGVGHGLVGLFEIKK
ncbi:MAG: class I SAM-dependent methyltransferase [Deltaproteobacteria bacterium]|nr:class I SAM-dependent methyltransferase [Deltaproteobacteria bacterium]